MAEVPDITAAVARTLQALRADRGWSLDQLAARSLSLIHISEPTRPY